MTTAAPVAEAEGNKCVVCGKGYNPYDPLTKPPTCSDPTCWFFWTTVWDHRENPCWITGCLEVFCGIETPGYCCQCDVFEIEQEIKRRGLDKEKLCGATKKERSDKVGKTIVIALSVKELEVVLHALMSERDKVLLTGGDQYGTMAIDELDNFVSQLQRYQRGD